MSFALFDVVVVPFPYVELPVDKRRPALVVSRPDVEADHGWLWLAMITSAPGPLRLGDAVLADLKAAGLTRACRVRTAKLATLDRATVVRRTGALSDEDRAGVVQALQACAGW